MHGQILVGTVALISQFDGRLTEEFNQKLSVDGKSSAKIVVLCQLVT